MNDPIKTIDVILRIHPTNLESLLRERHPANEVWLEEVDPDVYTLQASVPIGFEVSRNLPNLIPGGSKLDELTAAQKQYLAAAWEREHGA